MKDFLGNELKVGDKVVWSKNKLTGSSTIRKVFEICVIEKFTPKQILTDFGYAYSENIIKIISQDNQIERQEHYTMALEHENEVLRKENNVLEKALKLACDMLNGYEPDGAPNSIYFKHQAEKELKDVKH